MVALGVRAVVRRGVTLTSTADFLTPTQLSQLPFNIQETKLIQHHGLRDAPTDVKHPLNMIFAAIKKGWQELKSQPQYLDLPAYDAVRCPFPTTDAEGQRADRRPLVLCPFGKGHEPNWLHLANALAVRYPNRKAARMLELASPRLVGQALYEGIRWARTCVVDWTGWRANVFFELGVRPGLRGSRRRRPDRASRGQSRPHVRHVAGPKAPADGLVRANHIPAGAGGQSDRARTRDPRCDPQQTRAGARCD